MGKHKPKHVCCVCLKRRVPQQGAVCFGCSRTLPNLPRYDERGEPPRTLPNRGAR